MTTNHQDALRMALEAMEEAIHVIENLKRAEYGNGTIVRLREACAALSAPLPKDAREEREDFEKAMRKRWPNVALGRFRQDPDEYASGEMQSAWLAWQARAAPSVRPVSQEDARDAGRYRRFRSWHPRLQTSYWTGQWWEPIYGEKMDACVDALDEFPQPMPHAPQTTATSSPATSTRSQEDVLGRACNSMVETNKGRARLIVVFQTLDDAYEAQSVVRAAAQSLQAQGEEK